MMQANKLLLSAMSVVALLITAPSVLAQDTAFTYQGKLLQSGQPADGLFDFEFALFDSATGGAPIALEQFSDNIQVRGGAFSTTLEFGSAIMSESQLYLQIRVRPDGSGSMTLLEPRQRIAAAPRSISTHFTQPNSVDSVSVINGSIRGDDVLEGSIGSTQIAANSIDNSKLLPGSVGADEIQLSAIDSTHIQNGSLRDSDIDQNLIQRRVAPGCATGSAIRTISSNGTVGCESVGLNAIPLISNYQTGVNNGGISEAPMADRTSYLCVLSRVFFRDVDGPTEAAACTVFQDNVRWILRAEAEPGNDADVFCSAICFPLNSQ